MTYEILISICLIVYFNSLLYLWIRNRNSKINNTHSYSVDKTNKKRILTNGKAKIIKPISLKNFGANCYLNSTLQGISSCQQFVKDIEILSQENDGQLEKLSLFKILISFLNGGTDDKDINISDNHIFRNWAHNDQQDSFELLSYVINEVYNEFKKYKENKGDIPKRNLQEWLKIPLPMRLLIDYEIRCECKSIVKIPVQSDLALHISIPLTEELDLQRLVDRFFLKDQITDYECVTEDCDGINAMKYTKLCLPLPQTLCIHLQRSFWNGNRVNKINKQIPFSKKLIIKSEFCLKNELNDIHTSEEMTSLNVKSEQNIIDAEKIESAVDDMDILSQPMKSIVNDNIPDQPIQNEPMAMQQEIEEKIDILMDSYDEKESVIDMEPEIPFSIEDDNEKEKVVNYKNSQTLDEIFFLKSVIVHYGSVGGGHYVCYKYFNNRWFLTDDCIVKEVNEDEVLQCRAYILFFEKL